MFDRLFDKTDDIFKAASDADVEARNAIKPPTPLPAPEDDFGRPEYYTSRGMSYYSVKAETYPEPSGCDFCDNWTYMQTCEPEEEGDQCFYACPDCIQGLGLPYDGPLDGAEEPEERKEMFKDDRSEMEDNG